MPFDAALDAAAAGAKSSWSSCPHRLRAREMGILRKSLSPRSPPALAEALGERRRQDRAGDSPGMIGVVSRM